MDTDALEAVKRGDLRKLAERSEAGIDVNARDPKKRTLLHHAVINGQHVVVRCLLVHENADVLLADEDHCTALHLAVAQFDDALVNALLENTSRDKLRELLDAKTKLDGSAALHLAAKADCFMNASYLLEYGANFEIRDHAGKRAVDIASGEELRELLRQIGACFAKAKSGDPRLLDELKEAVVPSDVHITPVLNCRDAEGRTILQVLLVQDHVQLALDLIWWRVTYPIDRELASLHEPARQGEVDALAELTRDCCESWLKREREMMTLMRSSRLFDARVSKMACLSLEKVHEVMLTFRRFEGEHHSKSANSKMQALEQVFEALGFNSEHRQNDSYYDKLPPKWKNDFASFLLLVGMVHNAIEYFLIWINRIRVYLAVKDDNVDKAQQLVKIGAPLDRIDQGGRTLLCHAVESGNRKMVKLLLKHGAKLTYKTIVSSSGWDIANVWRNSFYVAVEKGHVKVVKLLLKKGDVKEMAELVDYRHDNECTALHVAARLGHLEMAKTLLRYGATHEAINADGCKPIDVSGNKEVSGFLKDIENCFLEAKSGKVELVYKLKAMSTDDFMAVAGARNNEGQTLAIVAVKAKAKSVAEFILKMIREVKGNEK